LPVQVLAVILATAVSASALVISNRNGYMHGFRSFDLNFAQAILLSIAREGEAVSNAYKEMALIWLENSQASRRASLYLTFSSVHIIFCSLSMAISFTFDYYLDSQYYLPFFILAIIFMLLTLVGQLIRYRILFVRGSKFFGGFVLWYENASWRLAIRFPPLPPPLTPKHIARMPQVKKLIDNDEKLIQFLKESESSEGLVDHNLL